MGELEKYYRYHNGKSEPLNTHVIRDRLHQVKLEIDHDWQRYKRSMSFLNDEELKDSLLNMLIVYLIKKGIL